MFPWQSHYDESQGKYYYFNPLTSESVWELPQKVLDKIDNFLKNEQKNENEQEDQIQDNNKQEPEQNNQKEQEEEENEGTLYEKKDFDQTEIRNLDQFLKEGYRKERMYEEDLVHLMKRPARKQMEEAPTSNVAYTQGGLDYNIWYGRHLTESRDKHRVREKATHRLDPDLDTGYTKADLYEKFSSQFCFHFARGMCYEGENCKYYHRVPSLKECMTVDSSRDIFGRPRFAQQREDMGGVGSFLTETRTLMVSEFKTPRAGPDGIRLIYEIIWRHFSIYGEIEDINIKPSKGWAFIRFQNRCMAEFCKEAMMNQSLDNKEMILIRWAQDDEKNPLEQERRKKEEENLLLQAMEKKQREQQLKDHHEAMQAKRDELMKKKLQEEFKVQQENELKQAQIMQNVEKMEKIFNKIEGKDNNQQEENDGETVVNIQDLLNNE